MTSNASVWLSYNAGTALLFFEDGSMVVTHTKSALVKAVRSFVEEAGVEVDVCGRNFNHASVESIDWHLP